MAYVPFFSLEVFFSLFIKMLVPAPNEKAAAIVMIIKNMFFFFIFIFPLLSVIYYYIILSYIYIKRKNSREVFFTNYKLNTDLSKQKIFRIRLNMMLVIIKNYLK